ASALVRVVGTDAGEMSIARADAAPSTQAATANTPQPQPTSSTVEPERSTSRTARIDSTVVGWSPSPNVAPGSMRIAVTPGESGNGIQAGQTTKSGAIHVGSACSRHVSATVSSTSTSRHGHLASNVDAAPITLAR